jgi:hypothetical protein
MEAAIVTPDPRPTAVLADGPGPLCSLPTPGLFTHRGGAPLAVMPQCLSGDNLIDMNRL